LATAALLTEEALWIEDDWHGLAPEVEQPLQAYLDECHARSVGILPLRVEVPATGSLVNSAFERTVRTKVIGALVVEQFQSGFDSALRQQTAVICEQGSTALSNALEVEQLPLAGLMRKVAATRWWLTLQGLPRTLLAAGLLLLMGLLLTFVPAELRITARGELQPEERRDVFAPLDGVMDQIAVQHGKRVTAGEVLAVLRSPDLELQQRRVEGETQTARKRLEALGAGRVGKRFTTNEELQEYQRMTAEEAEIKAELAGLGEQEKILSQQQADLTVKSPLAGEVLTWDVANLLQARPVGRGQTLLVVANVAGPWVLELQLPDEQAGHVLAAYQQAQQQQRPVEVEYMLATQPGEKYGGQIKAVSLSTEMDREQRPSVKVSIALNDQRHPELRPGATATAQIACGQRALGYVWLHDLIDTVRTWLFF
jgi:multidrug efflux pump subunit AcrA (membrane-fusion protein)